LALLFLLSLGALVPPGEAADWARFRGPNGSGVAADAGEVPVRWSDSLNLRWKTALPGPGLSSPIVVGERVFVTCWTGYGIDRREPGEQKDLKRHLICIDRRKGEILWSRGVDAVLPEDPYRGMFTEHGYASHTPASDGEAVYVFFGKTGVIAFDLEGKQLWRVGVGTGSGPRGWGSASSPVLHEDLVIVTASAESHSLVALDKKTGKEIWRQQTEGLGGTWGTPILVDVGDGRTDLVLGVPYEIWGLNPKNGKLRWYCESIDSESMCASVVASDGIVYAVGGRDGGTIALRAGGKGDVTKTHVLWKGNERSRIGTPVLAAGQLCWVSRGILNCVDAKTGKSLTKARLEPAPAASPSSEADGKQEVKDASGEEDDGRSRSSGRRGRRGGRGRGGARGGQDYSSPVVAGDKLYYFKRSGVGFVVELGAKAETLATNRLEDGGDFNASPAVSDGALFIRSTKALYCIGTTTADA
jgi:outer membrane protein assembly factor BamB